MSIFRRKKEEDIVESEDTTLDSDIEMYDDEIEEIETIEKPKKSRTKLKIVLFSLAVFFAFAIGVFLLFRFNIIDSEGLSWSNIKSKIPIVKNLVTEEELEKTEEVKEIAFTDEELQMYQEKIKELEEEVGIQKEEILRLEDKNTDYAREVIRLQEIEGAHEEYKRLKEEIDKQIASGDPIAYEEYFESISPGNAEEIYRQIVGENIKDKELKKYISTYQEMDEQAAAEMFEEMIATDLDLVVNIIKGISSDHAAEILAEMEPRSAAAVTKRMSPTD